MGESFLRNYNPPKRQHVTPSIDLSGVSRTWQTVPAHRIEYGDIIPDFGAVEKIEWYEESGPSVNPDESKLVRFTSVSGKRVKYRYDEKVFVFSH